MYKFMFKLIVVVLTTCFSLSVFAQNFFSSSDNKKNTAPTPVYPPPNPVMTPDQFKSRVNTLSKQNSNAINQKISQQVSKSQAPTSQPPPAPKQPSDFSSLNPQSGDTGQSFGTSNGLPNPRPVSPGQQQQKSGSQGGTYTGFGGGGNTGNTGGSTTGSGGGSNSGGWNIKY